MWSISLPGNTSILLDSDLTLDTQDLLPAPKSEPLLLDGAFPNGVSLLDDPLASLGECLPVFTVTLFNQALIFSNLI